MTIEKLAKFCLQFLEQDSETDVMNEPIESLMTNSTFSEYLNNMEHSIYMGLIRFATSQILPIKEISFPDGANDMLMVETMLNGLVRPIYHKIKEVYATDSDGNVVQENCSYYIIGNKVKLKKRNTEYSYHVIYHPTVNSLDCYKTEDQSIWEIELYDSLNIPDEMAINIKYLVYSDLKLEENPSVANINKNYFENYLDAMQTEKVINVQTEVLINDWSDVYGD